MTPAERQRRYRQRQRLGLRGYRVYLDNWQVELLREAGHLNDDAMSDADLFGEQLGDAIEQLLSRDA